MKVGELIAILQDLDDELVVGRWPNCGYCDGTYPVEVGDVVLGPVIAYESAANDTFIGEEKRGVELV